MNIKTPIILTTALMFCAPVFAQTETTQTTKPIAPYGENPNLLHVFAYKAQEGVINTAEKVGEVTEKGIAKIKPGVDRAWDNTKSTVATTIEKVDQGATQVAQQTGQKIQQTKDVWRGNQQQQVPIEQQPLSQSSTATQNVTPQSPSSSGGATSYAVDDL